MIAVSAFVLGVCYSREAIHLSLSGDRCCRRWSPHSGFICPTAGWRMVSLSKGLAGEPGYLIRQRRVAGAATADYLRAVYADAVWHRSAAVPLLSYHFIIGFVMFLIVEIGEAADAQASGARPESFPDEWCCAPVRYQTAA